MKYLEEFQYAPQIVYILENENIYKDYQYSQQYEVFYKTGSELDFESLDIQKPIKDQVLNDREIEIGQKLEDFLIAKKPVKCAYNNICNFTYSEVGYARVGKIIQLTNNIVEIKKDWYIHKLCIVDYEEAADKLLMILQHQFRQFYGYSNIHVLFDATCIDLAMFMNDNGIETEHTIYMLAKHLFSKEKYKGHNFYFSENLHIWEKETDYPKNNKGVLINLAKTKDGILIREEAEKYLENLKFSKNAIIPIMHDISDSTFYFYTETTYILSELLQIDDIFISGIKEALNKLFDSRSYVVPRDIDDSWFGTLPKLPMGISWNLLLLQEIIRYNDEIGYKPLFADVEQSPYRISAAFIKADLDITLSDIIYNYTHNNISLPLKIETEKFRLMLRKAGFIKDMEWFTNMPKVLDDSRFAFSNGNKTIFIGKE
jgi:hypothetical protein